MRSRIFFAVAAALTCFVARQPYLGAQAEVSAQSQGISGLTRAVFEFPQGRINVNYPDDAAAGETISGTVYVEPSGNTRQQQEQNGIVLSGYVIELQGQKAPASQRHFLRTLPVSLRAGFVPIVLLDRHNHPVTQCSLPVRTSPLPPEAGPIDLPLAGEAGALASAWGPFDPHSETAITIGGRRAEIMAQSSHKVVFQIPPEVTGPTEIEVRNGGLSARGPFRSLGLRAGETRRIMPSGIVTTMTVLVSGLQDLREPLTVIIVNEAPGVVNLADGPVQRITVTPAEFRPDGTFLLTRTLTGEHGGRYNIHVSAELPPSAKLPLERIAARVIDSWSRSSRVEVTPEARRAILLGIAEARSQLDVLFRDQRLFGADPASLLGGLVRDYCFDLRDLKLRTPNAVALFPPRLRFAPAFAGFLVQAANSSPAVSLKASDVSHFSFLQYLADLLLRHSPNSPFGSLRVTSQPDKQLITVDQTTGLDYFTVREFVVSVGDHFVKVADCNERVTVNPNQQVTVNCPH